MARPPPLGTIDAVLFFVAMRRPSDSMNSAILRSFPPAAAADARILILGSMPGAASLAAGEYYAHPRNAFWKIMGALFGAGPEIPYDSRLRILIKNGVALWDVLDTCVRPGSLDTSISEEVPNDFEVFFAELPNIARIGFNGAKAAMSFKKHAACFAPTGAILTRLPSTSPAHAGMGFEEKCTAWREVLVG